MAEKGSAVSALKLSLELGYTIAIPIVLLALGGRLLDNKFGTSPWLLIGGIILSMVISSIGLVLKFNKILARIRTEEIEDRKKKIEKQKFDSQEKHTH